MIESDDIPRDFVSVLYRSHVIATEHGHEYITVEHMLSALLERDDIIEIMDKLSLDAEDIHSEITDYLKNSVGYPVIIEAPRPTELFEVVFQKASSKATGSGKKAEPKHILIELAETAEKNPQDSFALTLLLKSGITSLAIKTALSGRSEKIQDGGFLNQDVSPTFKLTSVKQAKQFVETYAVNLNTRASELKIDPLIGRETEVLTLVQIMNRRTKNNAVLVGEPGVGKTAIAEGLALKIVRKEVPDALSEAIVYSLEIASMIAGTRYRGDFEERMKQFITAFEMIPHAILFIDEIHTVMGSGAASQGSLDVANILKPALGRGSLRCIGSTTLEEFRKHFEKDRALHRRFKKIDINEPSIDVAKQILRGLAPYYEDYHSVKFTEEALDAAVDLTSRYVTGAYLPDKAIDIIDAAGATQTIANAAVRKINIGVAEIETEVSKVAHIPQQAIAEDETDKLARLEDDLRAKVIGQNSAILEVTDAVFLQRAGLKDPQKPAGSYLFVGPTGVGKTETAKTLANTLGIPLIRFDMSEYMEKHSVSKLIGAPPGYVGYGEGNAGSGLLVNEISTNPYCVLLLDEIEKAHPDIFNVFLQIMDYGKMTSGEGKSVDFQHVILIMTSNAGAAEITKNRIGFGDQSNIGADDPIISKMFPPEFRNRLDAIVKFDSLKPEHMLQIVDKFISQLDVLTALRNVSIDVDTEAREWLAKNGYDRLMGARPLQRVITDKIKKPLSRLMLTGGLTNGGSAKIRVVDENILVSI